VTLSLRLVGHRLLHGLQHLSLHYHDFLQSWRWWRVGSIILIVVGVGIAVPIAVPSVGHLEDRGVHEIWNKEGKMGMQKEWVKAREN
jgi:hypothetical protein